MTWTDNASTEDGYAIERRIKDGTWAEIHKAAAVSSQGSIAEYTDKNLAPATYEYRVRAFKGTSYSPYSNIAQVLQAGIKQITVTGPASGDQVGGTSTCYIKWTANKVAEVVLSYSIDDGLTWTKITSNSTVTAGDAKWGNYPWTVPDIREKSVIIKIEEYGAPEVFAKSEAFSIVDPAAAKNRALSRFISKTHADGNLVAYDIKGRRLSLRKLKQQTRIPAHSGIMILVPQNTAKRNAVKKIAVGR